ncbi:MAG: sulfite exporter TauE/SafE family protein [Gemmatimonadetes bacterium]|nr:sulfite exporter TauE/SafE family protein [Gemmatimonadota bacterium]MBT6147981.1 sulfite exporter TauE/SafE family protein [Gemmatimonadota bacterium]MBT7862992.1 sulfite exporter TauE/SafE family protein [Gemmatimonadota bacterium]
MPDLLPILFGVIVGLTLGLTGGGGSIFALPLLVYGMGVDPHQAVAVSLAAVGATAAIGAIHRLRRGEMEIGVGLIFAAAGSLGTPVGAWIGARLPSDLLLLTFSGLMLFVAVRMWLRSIRRPEESLIVRGSIWDDDDTNGPACRHDPTGRLRLTGRCTIAMSVVGLVTGILSGLLGVGGGFIIVPALMFFSTLGVYRAVATSLLVITIIGSAGLISHLVAGNPLDLAMTAKFVIGGTIGMGLGTRLSLRLSGPALQRLFAVAILLLASFMVASHLFGAGE